MIKEKIILPGGVGLVGLNLIPRLIDEGYNEIIVLDKHKDNILIAKQLFPNITIKEADVSKSGDWTKFISSNSTVVMLQAQIGGKIYDDFKKNNIEATQNIINIIKQKKNIHLVHISSSVVTSVANDFYTNSKKLQEEIIKNSGISCAILRPTLMYGWFDRKHLGWLSRFMRRFPIFPIPGNGKFVRQPLYAGDFCNIIISCIKNKGLSGTYNITGYEKIFYIDIIKMIKKEIASKAIVLKIPFSFFYFLIWLWSLFDNDPPFTTQQLVALSADEEFEVIDWPRIFSISYTPLNEAFKETFKNSKYSKVEMKF